MIKTFTKSEIEAKYNEINPLVQAVIASSENFEAMQSIAEKYKLHIDQQGALSEEIEIAMMGLAPTSEFASRIGERLSLDKTTADQIAAEVNKEIFLNARDMLRRKSEEFEEIKRDDAEALERKKAEQFEQIDEIRHGELKEEHGADPNTKAAILADIENPPETKTLVNTTQPALTPVMPMQPMPIITPAQTIPTNSSPAPTTPAAPVPPPLPPVSPDMPPTTVPFNPSRIPPSTVSIKTETAKSTPAVPKPDPYREAF